MATRTVNVTVEHDGALPGRLDNYLAFTYGGAKVVHLRPAEPYSSSLCGCQSQRPKVDAYLLAGTTVRVCSTCARFVQVLECFRRG